MTSHHILFTRPLSLRFGGPPLRVEGVLDGYVAGAAYEGRLQIIDNIGDCTVEWVSGTLPPGATVRVDNTTYEVVVEWPAYQVPDPNTTIVPNGSFEDGDVKWEKGAGWYIENRGPNNDVTDGTWSASYRNNRGISSLTSVKVPVVVGTSITATVDIQQGGSSKGNVVARILLCWYDAYGVPLPGGEGHSWNGGNIVRSGSNGAWHPSTVTANAPAGSFYVAVAVSANRKRQNKALRADRARWNHSYPTGANSDEDYCIVLRVRDSAGREAPWEGCVGEQAVYLTSKPYGYESPVEAYGPGLTINKIDLRIPPTYGYSESYGVGLVVNAINLRSTLQQYSVRPEAYQTSLSINGIDIRTLLRSYTMPTEAYSTSLSITGLRIKKVLISQSQPVEAYSTSLTITGVTIT